jgi:CRISPR type III-B/RAMP module-associated protein Cmr3
MTGSRLVVRIEPIDPLLFGDNRSARAGEDHALADQEPSPGTIYGAIGARIAGCLGAGRRSSWARAAPVLGEYAESLGADCARAELQGYALLDPDGESWFPRPLHAPMGERRGGRRELVALPQLAPAADMDQTASSLTYGKRLTTTTTPAPGAEEVEDELLIGRNLLGDILAGAELPEGDLGPFTRSRDSFFRAETRAGLGMDNLRNAAASGLLFTRPYRRFGAACRGDLGWRGAGYVAWYEVSSLAGNDPATWSGEGFLGGDRRRARLVFDEGAERPLADLLEKVLSRAETSRGYIAYLLTPAVAGQPATLGGREPIAAALGRARPVSGWDQATGSPRPLLNLIPAGTVFFYAWEPGLTGPAKRERLAAGWLASLSPDYGKSGFGRVLTGVWL